MSTIEKKSVHAARFLDNKEVDSLVGTYKQDRWVSNSEKLGKEDSLTVWYSVEELESMLERVKIHGGNGVKFAFAAYPQNYQIDAEVAGRQTMVMIATRRNGIGSPNKELFITDGTDAKILAMGGGAVCPPWCAPAGTIGHLGTVIIDRGDQGMSVI